MDLQLLRWRSELKNKPKRILLKIGSSCITNPEGGICPSRVERICKGIQALVDENREVILVCSGAIQTARSLIKNSKNKLEQLQALSALGQNKVISSFEKYMVPLQIPVAQILLTHEDFGDSERYFNLKNTLEQLLKWKCLPIINENDSISFQEITVGDNDQLAARIAENLSVDLLILLTESKGLFTHHPDHQDAEHIPFIDFNEDLNFIKTMNKSISGRGGMKTKLEAVRKLTPLGVPVIIADYRSPNPILEALTNSETSSFFAASPTKLNKKKGRLLTAAKDKAFVKIDKGARIALENNKSLLPVGIKKVEGRFKRGDIIKVYNGTKIVAHGIAEYSSSELKKLMDSGYPSNYPELFNLPTRVFIHKNNLILKN